MEPITSRSNPRVKALKALQTDRVRRHEAGLFVCEGATMLSEALRSGATVRELWHSGDCPPALLDAALSRGCKVQLASKEVMAACSDVAAPQGVVFTVAMPRPLLPAGNRFFWLDGVADPGNVGTILRIADAFAFDGVCLTGPCADVYNPKTVRSTMGAIFRVPTLITDQETLFGLLEARQMPIYGAALAPDSLPVEQVALTPGCIVIGNEAKGISPEVLARCHRKVIIPMPGPAESLNAAVAAGILGYLSSRS